MRGVFLILGFLLGCTTLAFSEVQFRLSAEVSTPIAADTADGGGAYLGVTPEVIVNKVGFGFDGAVRFNRNSLTQDWKMDFRGHVFASYHFRGVGTLIDPFILGGLGSSGNDDITNGVHRSSGPNLTGISLSLEPMVGAGLGIDLGGIVVGGRLLWYPTSWEVPAAPIAAYPISPFQVGVFAALAFGDHH